MAFCNSCGAELAADTKFCSKCGAAAGAPAADAAPSGGAPSGGGASSGEAAAENQNVMGALAYLVIPAVIFLVVEPYSKNKFIRFHSLQAVIYFVAGMAVQIAAGIIFSIIGFLSVFISPLLSLALFILWIYAVVQAFQGKEYRLPVIGDLAAKNV